MIRSRRLSQLLVDPDFRYCHWHAGEHAYCSICNQQTPVLYAVPVDHGERFEDACRACARIAAMTAWKV